MFCAKCGTQMKDTAKFLHQVRRAHRGESGAAA